MADDGSGDSQTPLQKMVAKLKSGNPNLSDAQAQAMAMRAFKRVQGGASSD